MNAFPSSVSWESLETIPKPGAIHTLSTQIVVSNFYFPQMEARLPDYRFEPGKVKIPEEKKL